MWGAIKAAIESNGRTVRFIVIIAVLSRRACRASPPAARRRPRSPCPRRAEAAAAPCRSHRGRVRPRPGRTGHPLPRSGRRYRGSAAFPRVLTDPGQASAKSWIACSSAAAPGSASSLIRASVSTACPPRSLKSNVPIGFPTLRWIFLASISLAWWLFARSPGAGRGLPSGNAGGPRTCSGLSRSGPGHWPGRCHTVAAGRAGCRPGRAAGRGLGRTGRLDPGPPVGQEHGPGLAALQQPRQQPRGAPRPTWPRFRTTSSTGRAPGARCHRG